ncbi:MAG: Planctomycete cytochrome, partial [Planctomycetaceae bacterium]|nr:Planctomycete cytochrome [Planctomycetaceae bacterium]
MLRFASFLLVMLAGLPAWAADVPDYVKDIKPILQRRCYNCHGALKQKGNLRLDFPAAILKGGDGGAAIEPGKAPDSLLIAAINGSDGLRRMPIEGEPLTAEEIAKVTAWINAGAQAPAEPPPADPRQHWSFQKPTRPSLPVVANPAWQQNPIDTFVAAEHERKGLVAGPEAPRHILLRRVYLDLTGLPPTRQEVIDFQNDMSADAYAKVVDRLLASPQYGERWGRHWMDVWRYSDWDGYGAEVRESQPHIWRWRDWVVESLNANKGYDQMIQEMLAADEISPEDPGSLRATGYLVRNYFRFNRHIWMDNTVEHTSKAFLGMTVNCARCHDHMYDPIAQQEYYQMRAIFEPYDVRTDRVANQPDATKDGLARVYDAHHATPTFLFVRGDDKQPVQDKPIEPAVPAALGGQPLKWDPVSLPAAAYYPGVQKLIHDEAAAAAEVEVKRVETLLATTQQNLSMARKKLADFQSNAATPPAPTAPILIDKFAAARPELWKMVRGKWEYKDGRLFQHEPTDLNSELVALTTVPRDFHAKFRFKITGGKMWKSVGLTFDAATDKSAVGVYLSSGGSKAQLYTLTNGQMTYPAEAAKPQPFALGEEHELQVFARDQLVNVAVNGQLVFAYKLPQPRIANGEFRLWTFDATAEFLSIQVDALPAEVALVEKVTGTQAVPQPMPLSAESLAAAVKLSEQALSLSEANLATSLASRTAVQARIAADMATYTQPTTPEAPALAEAAVKLERELALKQAQQNHLQQEQALA